MIEKRITLQLLETGELSLSERDCAALSLPEHSATIMLDLDGESFGAQWNGRSRNLRGDLLTDRLQDYGQDQGLLRLRLVGEVYRLQLLPPGSPMQMTVTQPPVTTLTVSPRIVKAKQRRATVDRQYHADSEYDWGKSTDKKIGFLSEARALISEQLSGAGFDPLELLELRLQGEELATLDDFEELIAVDVANVDRMPHQEAVARHALSRMRGRAVLADEVGLGKTIEAGLAMKELTLRGLAKRVLILCPAPLREQWREEMSHKFDMAFEAVYRGYDVHDQDKLILSLHLGLASAEKLTKKPWDIVIVDEAHRAAGVGARKTREFITALTTSCRYAFFLTATPVQNDLLELYRIVELLRPGTFASVNAFKRQFMTRLDPRTPNDPAALRRLISSVMIRTTRAQAGVDRVVRRAADVPVDLGPKERELYALSTDLLRNVMSGSGDTMRRRTLALRLTASPFAMGTTAMAMAKRHPDARVRSVLNEVGHLAMDIQGSARENRALEITRDWIREHGRVLIFSKHTDTVTSLLRRMGQEGLPARAFHSSMSVSERAATISAFRSGDAPVMISTDAGAEGQNLQFCNCVLNFDLPWNPMRIEQRIGRVDRLTQPRDEVFVANLYARNTIDESVYRLLAEKLRMFELLFGQVTTILGELDDTKSASFETRVLEALFAENDVKMERLLGQLGTELVGARERASELIAADKGLSDWMSGAFEHRKELPKGGASELLPEVSERTRKRQRRVQAWVRRTLEALEAEILHDTGSEDGAFITAKFADEFEEELGGRTTLHLAFDRLGLDHHPEAELCAIGSPVFDELLALLRVRGDLYATVPIIPDELGPSPLRHSARMSLISRRLVPTGSWRGQATFRANVGEAETTEHIVTAEVESASETRLPRRPLADGERLPKAFADVPKLIKDFEKSAAIQLEGLRRDRESLIIKDQNEELKRIRSSYKSQINEAPYDDRRRLERALDSEEKRLGRRPDVRARAKVLAVAIDEADWVVEERWSRGEGVEATLTYEWGLPRAASVRSAATGIPVEFLDLCSAAHVVDSSELSQCNSCDCDLCGACGDASRMLPCPLCDLPMCGNCRKETGGLCRRCASPERAPEFDREHAIAWRLNGGNTLLVGQRVAELRPPDDMPPLLLVPNEDVEDPARARVRAYACARGLPLDAGLTLVDRTARDIAEIPTRLCLVSSDRVESELSVDPIGGSSLDRTIVADVPVHSPIEVTGEGELKLDQLLRKLRDVAPPPPAPAVVITRRAHFSDTYLEVGRLVNVTTFVNDFGALDLIDSHSMELEWRQPSESDAVLAQASIDDLHVSISSRNDAVLIRADNSQTGVSVQWLACPEGISGSSQLGYFDLLCSIGKPGGRIGQRVEEATSIVGAFPKPRDCEVDRVITPIARLDRAESQTGLMPASEDALLALTEGTGPSVEEISVAVPPELSRLLLQRSARDFTTVAMSGFSVSECWHGHGTARSSYETFDGQPLSPPLDDAEGTAPDFGVCREGHFYRAGTAALCSSCQTWACRACDEYEHHASVPCPGCSAFVCRRCLLSTHDVSIGPCANCGNRACTECGRDPQVVGCAMCTRTMCADCRPDACKACTQLAIPTQKQLEAIPEALAASGASLMVGSDDDAMVVFINRGEKSERAILRNGSVADWTAFGVSRISNAYKLRIATARSLAVQIIPVEESLEIDANITQPHIKIDADRSFRVGWAVPDLEVQGISRSEYPNLDVDPMSVVVEEFPPVVDLLPKPQPETPLRIKKLLGQMASPNLHVLKVHWIPGFRDVVLTELGILTRIQLRDEVSELIASWNESSGSLSWVSEDWTPVPNVLLHARSEDAEAAVVGIGLMLALGITCQGETRWFEIRRSDDAAGATALSRWLGLGDVDQIGNFTDPASLRFSSILNATSAREVQPVGAEATGAGRGGGDVPAALRIWLPAAKITVPSLDPLQGQLRADLQKWARASATKTTLEIGLLVKESTTLADGRIVVREINLAPGKTDARRADDVTGEYLDRGILDREGHFIVGRSVCRYCQSWVCARCIEGLASCDCCGMEICQRCISEPHHKLWLCPACVGIHMPTRREAREHGRLISKRGMLIGTDEFHSVVVEHSKNRWERQHDGQQRQPIANPSVIAFLDGRLAGHSSR